MYTPSDRWFLPGALWFAVDLSDEPDFWGPDGPAVAAGGQQASEEPGRRRRVP